MAINRKEIYRFPWSRTDNPGSWIETNDDCDMTCDACYRHTINGSSPLSEIKKDILLCKELTNCDGMGIAGGEPLIYPHLPEVINFIADSGIKPILLTNGLKLTPEYAKTLKDAGLAKIHFHVDSGQKRPGWEGKNEIELNELRQEYADMLYELKGIQCGYNVTVFRSTMRYIPDIVEWCRKNINKVQHISFIAFRALPLKKDIKYKVLGRDIDLKGLKYCYDRLDEIDITSDEMYGKILEKIPDFKLSAYLCGTEVLESYKYLIAVHVGSKKKIYGYLGPKTIELVQIFYHFFKKRYPSFLKKSAAGKKIFILASFDKNLRRSLKTFIKACLRNPLRLFDNIYTQTIHLQQPNELLNGKVNLCDGCANMMVYKDRLINSCRLDEYRMFGGLIVPVRESSNE